MQKKIEKILGLDLGYILTKILKVRKIIMRIDRQTDQKCNHMLCGTKSLFP